MTWQALGTVAPDAPGDDAQDSDGDCLPDYLEILLGSNPVPVAGADDQRCSRCGSPGGIHCGFTSRVGCMVGHE